jgi:hypothetical protein
MISIIAMELLVRIWMVLVFTRKEISPAKMKIVVIVKDIGVVLDYDFNCRVLILVLF